MSCSPFDLKDYFFGELAEDRRREVAAHVEACRACQEELDRLRLTQAALCSLREEEVPRRIAFVSDPVLEPRWWQALWSSGSRLGFASASVLALAIVVHAFVRPVPRAPSPAAEPAAVVAARIDQAVRAAEARQAQHTQELIEAVRRELDGQRRQDRLAVDEALEYFQKEVGQYKIASYRGQP
jgi:anti-sigma factor RsiW